MTLSQGQRVEVMRGLSNHNHPAASLLSRAEELSDLAKRTVRPKRRMPRSLVQRRLSPVEVGELSESYRSGVTILDLADRFGVSRTTVIRHLGRAGAETRYNRLEGRVDDAYALYAQGMSLAAVAARLEVSAGTVSNALKRAGIATRPVGINQWSSESART
jgi:transposase-like protein